MTKAPDFEAIAGRLAKARKDVAEWRAGLVDAEAEVERLKVALVAALDVEIGVAAPAPINGARPRAKKRKTMDYDRRRRVIELIREKGGFLTIAEAAKADHCDRDTMSSMLGKLCKEGKVRRVSKGRFALPESEMPS